MLMPSVVPEFITISLSDPAFRNRAMAPRTASYFSVATFER